MRHDKTTSTRKHFHHEKLDRKRRTSSKYCTDELCKVFNRSSAKYYYPPCGATSLVSCHMKPSVKRTVVRWESNKKNEFKDAIRNSPNDYERVSTSLDSSLSNIIKISPPSGLLTRSHNRHHYIVPRSRLDTVVSSFYPRAIRIWNTIPKAITEISKPE